ncbi:hypothetical protein GCM10023116_18880 [Kistimonas scapharcae]|uniref:Uncharacterized protein n=2 Tax=Kistimonas scapharcae TaxID=1036133 RepID=A0ABP8V2G1_9GAMM
MTMTQQVIIEEIKAHRDSGKVLYRGTRVAPLESVLARITGYDQFWVDDNCIWHPAVVESEVWRVTWRTP